MRIVYPKEHLVWSGILMFMMHLGSRRQFRHERDSPVFAENLRRLCGHDPLGTVADPDTLHYYARRMKHETIGDLLAELFRRLVRRRALDGFRLLGRFPLAIDGSQMHTFKEEPWPGCPHRSLADGSTQYFSFLLDAKFVTPSGLTLTLATEWLTNEGKEDFDKQDCEAKAFSRLAGRLKTLFPRMPFCILLDSLSANQVAIGSLTARPGNVHDITNKGGRLRWKIENEGYNVQKNHGYAMEHLFSGHPNGSRVFYLLLLLAHFFTQLILHSNLFVSEVFGSAKNFARRLVESFRHVLLPEDLILPGQIRFHPP
jgi:hypothetical protein